MEASEGGSGGPAEETLSGPCREPAPPHLCVVLPGALAAETVTSLGLGLVRSTQRFTARVSLLGAGPLPSEVGPSSCEPAFGIEEGLARSGAHLEWVQLDLGGSTAWLSVSAPPDGLGLGAGDLLEVDYSVLDDLLSDFEPTTRSLLVTDAKGALRFWLASSVSVAALGEVAPPEVGLRPGLAQCRAVRSCLELIQRELTVSVAGTELVLTQGDLASARGWAVLAGQSEVMGDGGQDCTVDGSPQLASVGVWRLPE